MALSPFAQAKQNSACFAQYRLRKKVLFDQPRDVQVELLQRYNPRISKNGFIIDSNRFPQNSYLIAKEELDRLKGSFLSLLEKVLGFIVDFPYRAQDFCADIYDESLQFIRENFLHRSNLIPALAGSVKLPISERVREERLYKMEGQSGGGFEGLLGLLKGFGRKRSGGMPFGVPEWLPKALEVRREELGEALLHREVSFLTERIERALKEEGNRALEAWKYVNNHSSYGQGEQKIVWTAQALTIFQSAALEGKTPIAQFVAALFLEALQEPRIANLVARAMSQTMDRRLFLRHAGAAVTQAWALLHGGSAPSVIRSVLNVNPLDPKQPLRILSPQNREWISQMSLAESIEFPSGAGYPQVKHFLDAIRSGRVLSLNEFPGNCAVGIFSSGTQANVMGGYHFQFRGAVPFPALKLEVNYYGFDETEALFRLGIDEDLIVSVARQLSSKIGDPYGYRPEDVKRRITNRLFGPPGEKITLPNFEVEAAALKARLESEVGKISDVNFWVEDIIKGMPPKLNEQAGEDRTSEDRVKPAEEEVSEDKIEPPEEVKGAESSSPKLSATVEEAASKLRSSLQSYVDLISQGDSFEENWPDVFVIVGTPDLTTYLQFAEIWVRGDLNIPMVLAGGRGRGTVPLIEKMIAKYGNVQIPVRTEDGHRFVTLEEAITDEEVYETDLLHYILTQEGIEESWIHFKEFPSFNTPMNYANAFEKIKEIVSDKEYPVIAIVTSPPLLLRVQPAARSVWKERKAAHWQVKRFQSYAMDVSNLSIEELIKLAGYVAGFPNFLIDLRPDLNYFSEIKGTRDWYEKLEEAPSPDVAAALDQAVEILPRVKDSFSELILSLAAHQSERIQNILQVPSERLLKLHRERSLDHRTEILDNAAAFPQDSNNYSRDEITDPSDRTEHKKPVTHLFLPGAEFAVQMGKNAFDKEGRGRIFWDRVQNRLFVDGKELGDFGEISLFPEAIENLKAEYERSHPEYEVLAVLPNSNIGFNDWFIAVVDGKVYRHAQEPLEKRAYPLIVCLTDGSTKAMEIRFKNVEGEIHIFDSEGEDVTAQIRTAFFGEQIVKDRKLNLDSALHHFDDVRHLLRLPVFYTDKFPGGQLVLAMGLENSFLTSEINWRMLSRVPRLH